MATIKKREGKNGTTYLIRSSCGYTVEGRQVEKSMTWKPAPGMTPRQIEKELNRQAVLFDEKCAALGAESGNIKFEAFAKQWFRGYAETNLRPRTVARLHDLEERTYQAIGHIRVDKLTARQIQSFVDNLGEEGINHQRDLAKAKTSILDLLTERGMNQKQFAVAAGVSPSIISSLCRGEGVTLQTAEKVSAAMGRKLKDLFTVEHGKSRLAPKTIQHYLSFISSVLDYAYRLDMIQANPCRRVVVPSAEQTEKDIYTLEEAQNFLDSLEEAPLKYRAFFVLDTYSGLRNGELLGLEWANIDFENQIINVRQTSQYLKDRGTFTDTTKTQKSQRSLKLPASVFQILHDLRRSQYEERLRLGDLWEDSQRVFVNDYGKPLHPNTPYHWLRRFCEKTNQRFLGIHAFRHLNASLLINSGADVRTVSSSLGHSQTSTTLNIYAHTFQEAQARASAAVENLLENRKVGAG